MDAWVGNPELHGNELIWKSAEESADIDMLRPVTEPFQADGGMRLVQGNLGRAVFKTSAVEEERWIIEAPARCFSDQNEVLEAFTHAMKFWDQFWLLAFEKLGYLS